MAAGSSAKALRAGGGLQAYVSRRLILDEVLNAVNGSKSVFDRCDVGNLVQLEGSLTVPLRGSSGLLNILGAVSEP
uniref:Uncharacterized protein n=1 Tax=Arundo donax TaxID=35708 RepID=A0A0A8YXG6_ARUDO